MGSDSLSSESFFTSVETKARVGHYIWVEQQLYGLTGAWLADQDSDEAKFLLGRQSYHHQFLAELWVKRLQQLGGVEALIEPADAVLASELANERWVALAGPVRLVVLYRSILPRMAATYSHHLETISEQTDGPSFRILNLCLNDYQSDWMKGEYLLQQVLAQHAEQLDTQISGIYQELSRLEIALAQRSGLIGASPRRSQPAR